MQREKNEQCAAALNCTWDSNFEQSMGDQNSNTCPSAGTKCLLSDSSLTENTIANIENSLGMYYSYPQHRNPYTDLVSEFGEECDANTINAIENVCIDKNIGISYRFEPVSCTPGHPQFNLNTCNSNCSGNSCSSPVLVTEPDLSAFKCSLDGLDQLENYCKEMNDNVVNDPNLENLGFTPEQLQLPSYNTSNYPYTGCNQALVEQHMIYIRSLLMDKLYEINTQINDIIQGDAERLREYAQSKLVNMNLLNQNIYETTGEINRINTNVLRVAERIGRIDNEYNRIRNNIVSFNDSLDLRFERKKRDFIYLIFFSFVIVNILFFMIFFRKK